MKAITHSISFTLLAALAMFTLLALPFTSFAATPNWELTAPSQIDFLCSGLHYLHTVDTIDQDADGTVTGTGSFDPDSSYTWDVDGSVSGDSISLVITYTGTLAGSVYNLNGTIASDGSVSGSADSYCQSFTMPAGSLIPIEDEPTDPETKADCKKGGWEDFGFKNQGQCVRFVETGKDSR